MADEFPRDTGRVTDPDDEFHDEGWESSLTPFERGYMRGRWAGIQQERELRASQESGRKKYRRQRIMENLAFIFGVFLAYPGALIVGFIWGSGFGVATWLVATGIAITLYIRYGSEN